MIQNLAALRAQFSSQSPDLFSQFKPGHPCRLNHLSLEQQKKQAKELTKKWHASTEPQQRQLKLSDAQHAIAKEYGFRTWSHLKTFIEQARLVRKAIEDGRPISLDAQQHTLHIRCGNDIQHALAVAGFVGDFLNVPDPYVHGPVPVTATQEEFIRVRANYLSAGESSDEEDIFQDLSQIAAELASAHDYEAVYLWFEHDPHDQLMIASLLDYFSEIGKRPAIFKMINITHYPGVKRFNGIGQLPPEAMPILWEEFKAVTPEQFAIGKLAWHAIRASTPQAMLDLVATGTPDMPTMAIALERFLKQLPSTSNGLNLTENLTLQILADRGATTAARLFGAYTNTYEPLPFIGDSGYWQVLEDLAQADNPAIVLKKTGEKPGTWQVSLTETGQNLLENKKDWLELNTINRWVGGIHLDNRYDRVYRIGG